MSRTRLVLPLILLVASLVGAAPGTASADAGLGSRAGEILQSQEPATDVQVLDGETGEPLLGALVQGFDEAHFADADGRAPWPAAGPFQISAAGYEPVNLSMARPIIRLAPMAQHGLVVDTEGAPVPGATVVIGEAWAETDAGGRFVFRGELAGDGPVIVKKAGYRPFEGEWDGESALEIEPVVLRAIYISFPRLSPDFVPPLLERAAAAGFNGIIVDAKSDRGLLGWESQVPLATQLPDVNNQAWMSMDEVLEEARKYNFYTIARIVTFKDHPLATTFPDRAVKREDGSLYIDQEELAWASPFLPENWQYNVDLGKELAAMGFDEINYDYIRLPSDGTISDLAYPEYANTEGRTSVISSFLNQVRLGLKPTRALFSGDVFGLVPTVPPGVDMGIGQTLETMAPYMDILCPMVYPSTFIPGNLGLDDPQNEPYEVVYISTVAARERSPIPVRPWLQGYYFGPEEWAAGVQAALDSTHMGFIFWLASGGYPEFDYGGIFSAPLPTEPQQPPPG